MHSTWYAVDVAGLLKLLVRGRRGQHWAFLALPEGTHASGLCALVSQAAARAGACASHKAH